MMDKKILETAYAGILHDIGKFYQRTENASTLNKEEKYFTPNGDGKSHVHSGYTARFFKKYLQLEDSIMLAASNHHLKDLDGMENIIKRADCIASKIDRSDARLDIEEKRKRDVHAFRKLRLISILNVINFSKNNYLLETKDYATFKLDSIDKLDNPIVDYKLLDKKDSVEEYNQLFKLFVNEVNENNYLLGTLNPHKFHRMYALLYKYTSLIPSSTFETSKQTVSLFDHLKLTAAIASCLIQSKQENFYMVEFDISGIQRFIYNVTEGDKTKPKLAKSLRGRSILVSIITNAVIYALLHEFSLTQANIIFNTGGGAVILLPYLDDVETRVVALFTKIIDELYQRFNASLTLVYGLEQLTGDQLYFFKTEKALSLKVQLENNKNKKYRNIISRDFIHKTLDSNQLCPMCNSEPISSDGLCSMCKKIIKISDYYTNHDCFSIYYSFTEMDDSMLDLGFVKIKFIDDFDHHLINQEEFYYIDAINHFKAGNVKLLANLVAKKDDTTMTFEELCQTLPEQYGLQKLGILKMDIDNLGAVFAFGLKQVNDSSILQRSLSKYLTLSRFIEIFFGQTLKHLCKEVSLQLQIEHENIFYINYAGGDDLVILGPAYAIVTLAAAIHSEFKKFVYNQDITLSAGIHFQTPKKPVRFGIKVADKALTLSKENKKDGKLVKNAITIFDKTVAFDEFLELFEKVKKYCNYLNNQKISKSLFYSLLRLLEQPTIEDYYVNVPIIQYLIYRQSCNDLKIKKEIAAKFTTIENKYNLDKGILIVKLILLFTREVN